VDLDGGGLLALGLDLLLQEREGGRFRGSFLLELGESFIFGGERGGGGVGRSG
jgi:hypothetical protein